MSARRLLAAALGAGLLAAVRVAPVVAQTDSVLARVGGDLSGRAGQYIDVPVTVDLRGAPGRQLGSYRATLTFDPTLLALSVVDTGSFAPPQVNTAHALDSGKVVLAAVQPGGASGVVTIFVARFYVLADTLPSPVTIAFDEMSATAGSQTPFESLLPLLRIVNGIFCRSLGRWGDVNGDGVSNSFDALVALSKVVGDTIPPSLNADLADVDADGRVTSRDALIILSNAVGLPVPGYRILLTAAGTCGTGAATTLAVSPDSLELQVGQEVAVLVAATDASGRAVPADSVSWTSSDPSIAAFEATDGKIQARAPGLATLTARLGPGVAGTLKVSVLARRTTWYVDVGRARLAPLQTGSQALPFEFIGDALPVAHDGDTVRVASGVYEETIGGGVAVVILGDPVTPPILDPRAAPYFTSYGEALNVGSDAGLVELANFDVRAGYVHLSGHDVTVRNVHIEGLDLLSNTGLDILSANLTPSAAPRPSGPMRSGVPVSPGSVLVDGVVVSGDSFYTGILVQQADSVVIRNSTVSRAVAGTNPTCGTGSYVSSGIVIQSASVSLVQNNTVTNPACQGIGAFDDGSDILTGDVSRVTISGNKVSGAPGTGIGAGARLIAFDHNAVRGTGVSGTPSFGEAGAIHTIIVYPASGTIAPDSVVSLGDSLLGSFGSGLVIDTARAAVIDSLTVDVTGLDGDVPAPGVGLAGGGTFTVSHSHIADALTEGIHYAGEHTVLRTHGNHIVHSGDGISDYSGCYICAPPARPSDAAGPGPQRVGPYAGGPDTLISVSDTIVGSGSYGIYSRYGVFTRVDSAVVDSAFAAIFVQNVGRLAVDHSSIRWTSYGIYAPSGVDSLSLLRDAFDSAGTALQAGSYLSGASPDSIRIVGTTFHGGSFGINMNYANARVDSSVFAGNSTGLLLNYGPVSALVRWSRFDGNAKGLWMNTTAGAPSTVVNSTFMSSTIAGAQNNAATSDTLYASNNWWNDAAGPACNPAVTGYSCPGGTTADTIVTTANYGPIIFSSPLGGPPPTPVSPVRPMLLAAAPHTAAPIRRATQRLERAVLAPEEATARAAAARSAASAAATAQRTQREVPAAWHGPSKAKGNALQVTLRKRP